MTTFAQDLSTRLISHDNFWSYLGKLQGSGVAKTLSKQLTKSPSLGTVELNKLLYCASVFVQTNDDQLKGLAQSIALNTLVLHSEGELQERCLHLLTELGNFPGLAYAERTFGRGDATLLGFLNRKVSRALNTVPIGGINLPLTDYQMRVWERLPKTKALAISAPTSAGKSFLVVEHMCRMAESRSEFLAVYIAPTRALLSEVHLKVQTRLSSREDIRVSTVPTLDALARKHQIFILTQERLHVLLSIWSGELDLVVVDEAQNLSDAARGMILQDCLETIVQRKSSTQVIMIAPGAVGLPEVAKTIGVKALIPETTAVSPVLQNRIVVTKKKSNEVELSLLKSSGKRVLLGTATTENGLDNPTTRLAAVALELGGDEGSLVYETGPNEAEKTALQLMNGLALNEVTPPAPSLEDLSKFIKDHIHPEYSLAKMVLHGVAYHYGRMPSLLREALETSFKVQGTGVKFLVCTTTLAQGINLPARNVFIDTPKRGRGESLDPALLWNFAGRAGRLNQDIVGNVFLVNYDDWDTKPMDEFVPFTVQSAITTTLEKSYDKVRAAVSGSMPAALPWDVEATEIRACAGLLISKASRSDSYRFIQAVMPPSGQQLVNELSDAADRAVLRVALPADLISANWTIDPYGLRRLYDRMLVKISAGELEALIPVNPSDAPDKLYSGIFSRILREVYGRSGNFGGLVASLAIPWMKGVPYPVLLSKWVKYQRRKEKLAAEKDPSKKVKARAIDAIIRDAFALIEDVVRFQFVQLGKAYRDLLLHALRETGHNERIGDVFDFALALELGISTGTGTAFVELGLSRISAAALADLYPNSTLTSHAARQALRTLDVTANKLSPIIIAELERLGLRETAEA